MPRRKRYTLFVHDGMGCYYDPATDLWYTETGTENLSARITWGEPAILTQVKFDKCCPLCGLSRADGFDMGIHRGRLFGARCPRDEGGCGWSF